MYATFVPPNGDTLAQYAAACGFLQFDWQQLITTDPGGSCKMPFDTTDNASNIAPDGMWIAGPCVAVVGAPPPASSLMAGVGTINGVIPPSYFDPPLGGYANPDGSTPYNPYPFYYLPSETSTPPGRCQALTFFNGLYCTVSPDDKTLSFEDAPSDHALSGEDPSITTNPYSTGKYLSFWTKLVGVSAQARQGSVQCDLTGKSANSGFYCTSLFSWNWNSTFNGHACPGVLTALGVCTGPGGIVITGVDQTSGSYPIVPGSGTGGIAVTSINGVQLPTALPPSQVATTASGLAYSRVSQTFNGTVTVKNIGASVITGPIQVVFFGLPANVTLVNATGNLSGTPYLTVPGAATLAPG
jgi:hypothetical protein